MIDDATLSRLNDWFVAEVVREAFEIADAEGLYSLDWNELKKYVAQTPDGRNAPSVEEIVSRAKEIGLVVAHGDEGLYKACIFWLHLTNRHRNRSKPNAAN